MFPLRDDIPSYSTPVVNYGLIAVCVLVYLLQLNQPDGLVSEYGMIPARVRHPGREIVVAQRQPVQTPFGVRYRVEEETLPASRFHPFTTVLSCIFLHGSWLHLLGNMWFLWIFGDNVEDRMGAGRFLLFYLAGGIAASLTHFAFDTDSIVPTIGASGAVAAVMGAYMKLHPHARVTAVVPLFFIFQVMVVPAPVFLGIWFVIQLLQGTFSMGSAQAAGVAWWAHAGGFAFGFVIAGVLPDRSNRPGVRVIQPESEEW